MTMDENGMKEVVRHTMQVRYNERVNGEKKHLPRTTEEAVATILRAETQIAILTQQIEDAQLALGMLPLAAKYGLKLWDMSGYLPNEQWTFVGTKDEYAEKCKERGVPSSPAPATSWGGLILVTPKAKKLRKLKRIKTVKKIKRVLKKEG